MSGDTKYKENYKADRIPNHAEAMEILANHFDSVYYCERYSDIDRTLVNPLEHFLIYGWKEGRDPVAWFSTKRYLRRYGDVIESDINPFLHYILFGRREGRLIWPANYTGKFEMEVDKTAKLVSEKALRDLIEFPPRDLIPPPGQADLRRLDIHWLVPEFSIGSGGHMTIFRMIRWLELFGHKCTIWLHNPDRDAKTMAEEIIKHFQVIRAQVARADDGFVETHGDIVVATGWQTAARVMNARNFRERFYFVQDYEPSFHPMGSHALAALWSYSQDMACICASPWLAATVERMGRWSRHFWLAYDKEVYFPPETCSSKHAELPRIALYARRSTARRAVELAILALEHLAAKGVKFHVDIFGEELVETRAPFDCTNHEILTYQGLAALYRQADIGICFSSTNYSLVPQEMMACGLPVVEIDIESTRAIFPKNVVTFTGPHPLSIASDIESLLRNQKRRTIQANAALEWVSQFDWEKSARMIEQAFMDKFAQNQIKQNTIKFSKTTKTNSKKQNHGHGKTNCVGVKASVCIPIYNGGLLLKKVVDAVRRQHVPWKFEIVIVDSSSTDGSISQIIQPLEDRIPLRVQTIPKSEFQHGRTRNLCASIAEGEFIAFLTQDALPANEFWLYNLVTVLDRFPEGAGAFGKHIAWPEATIFTKHDIDSHFDSFLKYPIALSQKTDAERYASGDRQWRQILHYFSDNNSCLRKSVWQHVPYPEVACGEDQMWAEKIIKLGYQKVYVPSACVYHSHDYMPGEIAERAETEAFFFATAFGYDSFDVDGSFDEQLAAMQSADTRWAQANGVSENDLARRLVENRIQLFGRARGMARAKAVAQRQTPVVISGLSRSG